MSWTDEQVVYTEDGTPIINDATSYINLEPRAYFSERRAMAKMSWKMLFLHLILRNPKWPRGFQRWYFDRVVYKNR